MGLGNFLSGIFGEKEKEDNQKSAEFAEKQNASESLGSLPGASEADINLVNDDTVSSEERSSSAEEPEVELTKELVLDKLSDVYDPELPIDIVNLGLIYEIDIEDGKVHVQMTMTAPGCPASGQITQEAQDVIEELSGVEDIWIEIVWDPPWDPSKMSEDAKLSMGFG